MADALLTQVVATIATGFVTQLLTNHLVVNRKLRQRAKAKCKAALLQLIAYRNRLGNDLTLEQVNDIFTRTNSFWDMVTAESGDLSRADYRWFNYWCGWLKQAGDRSPFRHVDGDMHLRAHNWLYPDMTPRSPSFYKRKVLQALKRAKRLFAKHFTRDQ